MSAAAPFRERNPGGMTLAEIFKFIENSRGDDTYIWGSTIGYLSQNLMIIFPITRELGNSFTDAGWEMVAVIGFSIFAVAGVIEGVARLIFALGIIPFAYLASCCRIIDEKTFAFLNRVSLIGGRESIEDATLSLLCAVAHLVFCLLTSHTALCGTPQNPQA